jgi:hypothetical protein
MTKLVLDIGADVHCEDGHCGRLIKVVADPQTKQITDLIVEKGFLLKTDRVLPISVVSGTRDGEIRLAISSEELADYPEYREWDFVPLGSGYQGGYASHEMVTWLSPYGPLVARPVIPMIRRHVREGIPSEMEAIGRGTPVHAREARVGEVDHLLMDRETGEISHVVVDTGGDALPIVPISRVERATEGGIFVAATEEEIGELSHYHPRGESKILADLQEALDASAFDFGNLASALEKGVVRLTGLVESVAAKRHAEATARSVTGVVDVENVLGTDTALAAEVTAALSRDRRTELAVIGVTSDRGIVTLRGKVDSTQVKEAAEGIAGEQEGVITVINELEIGPDEDTEGLRFRAVPVSLGWPERTPHL